MKFAAILVIFALAGAALAESHAENASGLISIFDASEKHQLNALHRPRRPDAFFAAKEEPQSEEAYALIEYKVRSSQAEELIQKMGNAKKAAEQQEGFKAFRLSRALDSNECLALWLHWESASGLLDFMHSDAAQDLKDHITKNDITYRAHHLRVIV